MDLALFDFDGTITSRETFPDFMYATVPPRRLAMGKVLLAPLILGYKAGLVSGTVVRAAIVRFGLRGLPLAQVEAVAEELARTVLPGLIRAHAMQRIRWHQARGDVVVVVSGGFDVYLRHWCDAHGVQLICSSLEQADGMLTGRYAGAQCVSAAKVARVRERYELARFGRVYAYGDTREDRELLGLADEAYLGWERVI